MDRQGQAYLYAICAVLLWSTAASAFELSLAHLDFVGLLLWSSLVSTAALFIILAVQRRLGTVKACTKGDWARSAVLGFMNPFLYYMVLLKAYSLLPAQEAQPLNYTWPIVLVILSAALLRQKAGPWSLVAVVVSFSGVLVIGTRGDLAGLSFHDPLGISLAVGSSLIWALFWIGNMKDGRDPVAKLFLSFVFGSVFVIIAALLFSDLSLPGPEGLAGAAYVGLFEMGITFVIWLKALQLSRTAAKVSNLIFLSPPISLVLIHFLVGEEIMLSTLAGLGLILAGIALQYYGPGARGPKPGMVEGGAPVKIRRAGPGELDEVVAMLSAAVKDMMARGPSQWNEGYPSRDILSNDVTHGSLFLAREGGAIVGMMVLSEEQDPEYLEVGWEDREGRPLVVHRLAVHPEWQRKGVGRALFAFADSFAKENGNTSIRLDTYSRNTRMLKLIERSGFVKRGEVRFRGLPHHFVCFERAVR